MQIKIHYDMFDMLSKVICWCNIKYQYILLYVNYKRIKKNISTYYIVKLYVISVQQGFFINRKMGHVKSISIMQLLVYINRSDCRCKEIQTLIHYIFLTCIMNFSNPDKIITVSN